MKVSCSCKHPFQDSLLGNGIRWANPVNKTKKDKGAVSEHRCTVCGRTHNKTVG